MNKQLVYFYQNDLNDSSSKLVVVTMKEEKRESEREREGEKDTERERESEWLTDP